MLPAESDTRTFDEIVLGSFDEFNSKSSQIRTNALTIISTQLQLTHNPEFLIQHMDKLLATIQSSLDSNIHGEIDAAASLISLAAIQLPRRNRSLQIFNEQLKATVKNNEYLRSSVRFAAFHAIAILTFLYETDGYRIANLMEDFRLIFVPSSTKVNKLDYERQILAAIETWTFLMTFLSSRLVCREGKYSNSTHVLMSLMESPCYGMRVASVRAVAVIWECGLDAYKEYFERQLSKIPIQISRMMRYRDKRPIDIKHLTEVRQYLEVSKR